ncbi:MAG: Nudix family hydrolase [Moraxellaceae bacterium]|nr:Nudix family hydrolase [Moraxellaceae bacterium]
MVKKVEVAAAVITRPDGSFLLGQRAPGAIYEGYWEFPGGKVEPGETPRDAVVRELQEELGITVHAAWPWLMREHHYEHAHVRLHFFEIPHWSGDIADHVHSKLVWTQPGKLDVSPMLPANGPILKGLSLPRLMGVTQAHVLGVDVQLQALDAALSRGLRLVQLRERELPADQRLAFAQQVLSRCKAAGAVLVINDDIPLAAQIGADGVHLPAHRLAALDARPDFGWVGASCHTREELERVAALGLDYAVLGPVAATVTHPDAQPLGWDAFSAMTQELPMPVFAIGGLSAADDATARAAGAHGVAAIRSVWGG